MMRYLLSLCSIAVALSAGAGGIAMKTVAMVKRNDAAIMK